MVDLTDEEHLIYMWQHDALGSFKTSLLETIAKADLGNRALLFTVFPTEVQGYINFSEVEGWYEAVEAKMEKSQPMTLNN